MMERQKIETGIAISAAAGTEQGRGGAEPERVIKGLVAGTLIATSAGWRAIETLSVGDVVMTFDNGLQPITRIERRVLWDTVQDVPEEQQPLHVPAGVLGNSIAMRVLPEQAVMVESDAAEALFGDPFALVPAMTLDGYNRIARVAPRGPVGAITIYFDTEQVISANSGALFLCPGHTDKVRAIVSGGATRCASIYRPLSADDADLLIECMIGEDEEDIPQVRKNEERHVRAA